MNMYDTPRIEFVKIIKKDEQYKVIYLKGRRYCKEVFSSLLDAIDYACQYASRDEVIYSISL